MTTEGKRRQPSESIDRRRLITSVIWTLLIFSLCLFLPAGTWAWRRGWLFLVVTLAASFVATLYLRRVNPDVVAARVNRHDGTRSWDRILLGLLFAAVMAIPILAALDDGRFHWSQVPWWVCLLGYALFLTGMAGMTWAESVNRFFEPTVRIQSERGHTVIDTGPYAVVRHPGYVAGSLLFVGIALCLGSLWALVPAGLASLVLIVRTRWEDQMLQVELAGYKEYTQRVRFRWIPGLW